VIADITSPPEQWSRLGDGYRVNGRFFLWESDDVTRVPTGALFRSDGAWAVFVIEGGRTRLHPVEPGRRGARLTEVLGGLDAGDLVVVHPDRNLKPGIRVRLRAAVDG
jgi:HlyD family secretion protein